MTNVAEVSGRPSTFTNPAHALLNPSSITITNVVQIQPQKITVGSFLFHVSPALLTLFVGYLIIQRFFVSRANEAHFIDALIKEVDELRNDALEYWVLEPKTADQKVRAKILEQKIKATIKSVAASLQHFCGRYCKHEVRFNEMMANVTDSCTGGDFETAKRGPDPSRYILIVNSINELKGALRKRKL